MIIGIVLIQVKSKGGSGPEAGKEYCQNRLVDKRKVSGQDLIIAEGICSGDTVWSKEAFFFYNNNFFRINPSKTVRTSDFNSFLNSFIFSANNQPGPNKESITLLTPNGGEKLVKEQKYTIT